MDPWANNEWSTEEDQEIHRRLSQLAPKWEHLDEGSQLPSTFNVDVTPSWVIESSGSAWDIGNDAWATNVGHAGLTTGGELGWTLNSQELPNTSAVQAVEEINEDEKLPDVATARPALPTPPSSPPVTSSRLVSETENGNGNSEADAQVLEIPEPSGLLTTPDLFGSFETAQESFSTHQEGNDISWPTDTVFEAETALEEPNWDSSVADTPTSEPHQEDEWEVAQETHRKLTERIPQELLGLIISQWETVAREHYSDFDLPGEFDYSWRKGLENVPGLLERVESFIPPSYFTLPTPFPKSEIGKATKEALRLTRSHVLSQSSPMSQFYSLQSSSEWERLVKMQNLVAKDEWGWDLKQGKEENSESQEAAKDAEKKGGFLSFWKRRTASESISATIHTQPEPSQAEKQKQAPAQSSTSSLRPSLENPPVTPTVPKIPSESDVTSLNEVPTSDSEPHTQPSVVSRLFNRFSRRPQSGIIVNTETVEHSSPSQVSLSVDDLAFLSDIETKPMSGLPSGSGNSLGDLFSSGPSTVEKTPPLISPPPSSSHGFFPAKAVKENMQISGRRDLLGGARIGSSSPLSMNPPPDRQQHSSFEKFVIPENKPLPLQAKPSTTLDSLSSTFLPSPRGDASIPPKLKPHSMLLPLPPPPSTKPGQSKPPLSHFKPDTTLASSVFDDFDDFVSSPGSSTVKDGKPAANFPANNFFDDETDGFGDFVFTSQNLHPKASTNHPYSNTIPVSSVKPDSRTSSSVSISKPARPFTPASSDSINGIRDLEITLAGKISPLPPPPSRLTPIPKTLATPSIFKPSTSAELTSKPVVTSSVNQSGLSAQDLSFFEGL